MPRGSLLKRRPAGANDGQDAGADGVGLEQSALDMSGKLASADASEAAANGVVPEAGVEKTKKSFTSKLFGRLTGSDSKKKEPASTASQDLAQKALASSGAQQALRLGDDDAHRVLSGKGGASLISLEASSRPNANGVSVSDAYDNNSNTAELYDHVSLPYDSR
jgi:hypothetical protein